MLFNEIKPSSCLGDFVRLYRIIDFDFPAGIFIPPKLYPPRPEHCLQFSPTPTVIRYGGDQNDIYPKHVSIVGLHTVTNTRFVGRRFLAFQVIFQPGAMFRLFGIPAVELTNKYEESSSISANGEEDVNARLYELAYLPVAQRYPAMIALVELYLQKLINRSTPRSSLPVDRVTGIMTTAYDQHSLDWFVKESCLSHRQFDRKFYERTGVTPKEYLRITRFDRAFRMKNKLPQKEWLAVAVHCGYHDYQHMTRDYKEFTGMSPQQFYDIDNKAPERLFGESET